jgi:hypothetical protein
MTEFLLLERFLQDYGFTRENANSLAILLNSLLKDEYKIHPNSDIRIFYQLEKDSILQETEWAETSVFLPSFLGDTGCYLQKKAE